MFRVKSVAGIQLIFANDFSSPQLLAKDMDAVYLQKVEIDQTQPVRVIKGDPSDDFIRQVYFLDSDGKELATIFAEKKNKEPISVALKPGEEIIGVYGHKNSCEFFCSLGFIVWTPICI